MSLTFLRGVFADERGFLGFIKDAIGIAKSVFGGGGQKSRAANVASVQTSARLESERLIREMAALRAEKNRQIQEFQTQIKKQQEQQSRTQKILLFGGGGVALIVVLFLVMKR